MNVLIVDDDIATVSVIRQSVPWDTFGVDQVFTAYNITAAKGILQTREVAVAVCDIEMPMGSGLDLIAWVRETGLDCEFIFLTCHESFDFAATAVEHQAVSYVLKPFHLGRMEIALAKAVRRAKEKRSMGEFQKYGNWWLSNQEQLEQVFWRDVCFGHIPAGRQAIMREAEKRLLSTDTEADHRLLLLQATPAPAQTGDEWPEGVMEYAVSRLAAEILLDTLTAERILPYKLASSPLFLVAALEPEGSEWMTRTRTLMDACCLYLPCTLSCFVGIPRPVEELEKGRLALERMMRNHVSGQPTCLLEEAERSPAKHLPSPLDSEAILGFLREKAKARVLNHLKQTLEDARHKNQMNRATLQIVGQDLLQTVYVFLNENDVQANRLFADPLSLEEMEKADYSLTGMVKWASFLVNRAVDYVEETRKAQTMTQRMKVYVEQHYHEPITRTEVAAHVFLTPEYAAKVFKKEVGASIKEYINDCRISQAKALMHREELRVSDVSSAVGFDNFSYFSTLFKKHTGLTPVEYRKQVEAEGTNP